jgi:3-hydroxyacyl-[acyl-carrier-protein] dehydratase
MGTTPARGLSEPGCSQGLTAAAFFEKTAMPPEAFFDVSKVDTAQVVADREAIRRVNPQRFEMEQLTAIVHVDTVQKLIIGYKDVRDDEFWVRGHVPGFPLFPGVLMCEAAAQLCSYYVAVYAPIPGDFLGFGGMENVRFRGKVSPGDRFFLVAKGQRLKVRQSHFAVQGFVGSAMVFNGDIIGVPIFKAAGAEKAEEV